jgi:SAM-dependent methyltransferase
MKQELIRAGIRQFGHPRGAAGNLAGWVMGHRSSNRRRNRWVVSLLDPQPADRVLEIGFGPGVAIAELSRRVGPQGHVHGLDHSQVMLRQASRRNAAAIRDGRVTLTVGAVEAIPRELDGPFDAILSVNSLGFWPAPVERLAALRERLAPGGRIALASQPRGARARTLTPADVAGELTSLLAAAGLEPTRTETLRLDPPVVCVLARRPRAA